MSSASVDWRRVNPKIYSAVNRDLDRLFMGHLADLLEDLNWIEHRLRPLGGIFVWSVSPWKNAADNLGKLKKLLKIAVDDSKSITEKVDAPWDEITYFGGDKHIAKKIISCYYPEDVVPIFKTEDIEKICGKLGIPIEKEAAKRVDKDYEAMSVGEKWEYLNTLLLEAKREIEPLKDEPTALFSRFLYKTFDMAMQIGCCWFNEGLLFFLNQKTRQKY